MLFVLFSCFESQVKSCSIKYSVSEVCRHDEYAATENKKCLVGEESL